MTTRGEPRPLRVAQAFERTLARLETLRRRAAAASARFTRWRIAIFLAGTGAVTAAAFADPKRGGWIPLAIFGAAFFAVAYRHGRLKTAIRRLDVWIALKRSHLARVRLDWSAIPTADHPTPDHHPYAVDLDVTGAHSLLRWLDTTVSTNGRAELRRWILEPAPEGFAARRALINDLERLSLFRDRIALEAALAASGTLDGERVIAAISKGTPPRLRGLLAVETVLAALTAALLTATFVSGAPGYWVLSLIAYGAIFWLATPHIAAAFSQAVDMEADLAPYSRVFAVLERRSSRERPALQQALTSFTSGDERPSVTTRRLAGLVAALNLRGNPLVHLLVNLALPWDLFFAERYRALHADIATRLPVWIERLGRIEAAAALAHYAHTHPEFAYPEIRLPGDPAGEVALDAQSVGHPLLPPTTRVTNTFVLKGLGAVSIVTGSNMSGKSTFLRTLGINLCLAQAGAPVCAEHWTSPWMRLYCCIRIDDSLDEGISYFYAEVKRLKRLLDAAEDRSRPPVFFLIDEIFRGTNNRERLIGSRHYVRALGGANAIGLVSTHDLELVKLADEHPRITTQHFRETVDERGLVFDYHLRPGPCPTTNALKIMAREGLPVPKEPDPSS
ncbi:MAG: MutS family DNA mismatch repair protein [Nitrospirota bacterium]